MEMAKLKMHFCLWGLANVLQHSNLSSPIKKAKVNNIRKTPTLPDRASDEEAFGGRYRCGLHMSQITCRHVGVRGRLSKGLEIRVSRQK